MHTWMKPTNHGRLEPREPRDRKDGVSSPPLDECPRAQRPLEFRVSDPKRVALRQVICSSNHTRCSLFFPLNWEVWGLFGIMALFCEFDLGLPPSVFEENFHLLLLDLARQETMWVNEIWDEKGVRAESPRVTEHGGRVAQWLQHQRAQATVNWGSVDTWPRAACPHSRQRPPESGRAACRQPSQPAGWLSVALVSASQEGDFQRPRSVIASVHVFLKPLHVWSKSLLE